MHRIALCFGCTEHVHLRFCVDCTSTSPSIFPFACLLYLSIPWIVHVVALYICYVLAGLRVCMELNFLLPLFLVLCPSYKYNTQTLFNFVSIRYTVSLCIITLHAPYVNVIYSLTHILYGYYYCIL